MLKKRLIPIILIRNGFLVQSKNFQFHQRLGHPIDAVKRLSEWCSDELILLDITPDNNYSTNRDDHQNKNFGDFLPIVEELSKVTFMPITVGGKIKNLIDVEKRFEFGADKVCLNSAPYKDPKIIYQIAKEFGSQSLVVSVDVRLINDEYVIFHQNGKLRSRYGLIEWLKIIQDNGAGEVLIKSMDRDGQKLGQDLNLIKILDKVCKIPIITCGGVGKWEDFYEVFNETNVSAVAASNIFHHSDQSVYEAKRYIYEKKINIRKPELLNIKNDLL